MPAHKKSNIGILSVKVFSVNHVMTFGRATRPSRGVGNATLISYKSQ